MQIDRKIIKALAVDTRINILKSLARRRKLLTELAKELKLANSTISEHLDKLEEVGLIKREETGHKWVYYSLTEIGKEIVTPATSSTPIIILLSSGLILILLGSYLYPTVQVGIFETYMGIQKAPEIIQPTPTNYSIYIILLGIILISLSLIKLGLDRRKLRGIHIK